MVNGGTVLAGGTWLLPPCAARGDFAPQGMSGMGGIVPHQGRRCCSTAAGDLSPVRALGSPWCVFWEMPQGSAFPRALSAWRCRSPMAFLFWIGFPELFCTSAGSC